MQSGELEYQISELIREATSTEINSTIFYYSLWPKERCFEIGMSEFTNFITNCCSMINNYTERAKNIDNPIETGLPFAEKAKNNRVPIMITMKFEITDNESFKIYDCNFIHTCISIIQRNIIYFFDISSDMKEVICFTLESEMWSNNDHQYKEVRFHFPYTLVDIGFINDTFIPKITADFMNNNVLHLLLVTPTISLKEIIRKQDIIVPLVGCKMSPKDAPLQYTNVYNYIDFDEINQNGDEYQDFTISLKDSQITPLTHTFITSRLLDSSIFDLDEDVLFWLPLILSVHFTDKITHLFSQNKPKISNVQQKAIIFCSDENDDDKKKMNELLSMVSPSRLKHRNYWLDIGRCIYNIYGGDKIGITVWQSVTTDIEFKDDCVEEYNNFRNEYYDLRTVAGFAREDNPEQYELWHNSWIEKSLMYSLSCDHVPVSQVVYKILWLNYIYDPSTKTWYKFTDNQCKKDIGALELLKDLNKKIVPIYQNLRIEYSKKCSEEKNPNTRKVYEESIKSVTKLIQKFDNNTFREQIVKGCKEYFKDDEFSKLYDENNDLMGWKNGVTECYEDKITFRGGKIQDYITKTTGNYFPSPNRFDENTSSRQLNFMYDYYSKLHTDNDLRHFFLKDQASFLQGGNQEKYFRNWIGPPNASKSQYVKFLQEAFGDYCKDLPNSSITLSPRGSSNSGPDPFLDQCKGARLAIVAETSISEPLDAAKIKKFTGNDRFVTRTLNQEGGSRCLSFKLIHMSNVVANTPNAEDAFHIREIIIPFTSKWVSNPPASTQEQYKQRLFLCDDFFYRKIRAHTQAQIYLMYKYYPIYKKEGLRNLPELIRSVTSTHQKNNDPYYNFIQEKIIIVYSDPKNKILDSNVTISTVDLYAKFKIWFNSYYPQTAVASQITFKNEMKHPNRLGPQNSSSQWIGVELNDKKKRKLNLILK